MLKIMRSLILAIVFFAHCGSLSAGNVFSVKGQKTYLNDKEFLVIGLRCSNALISDATTDGLIAYLDLFKSYGVNTISVFFMGSRFGDVKGYREISLTCLPDQKPDGQDSLEAGRLVLHQGV